MNDTEFYTATMAEVYARQGHFEKAVEIYRYLLEREPNRKDIAMALAEIEGNIGRKATRANRDLIRLFQEWLQLVLEYNRLKKLKKFQNKMFPNSE